MNEQGLGWDDYRLVLAIGRAGSLNGAAKLLRISHPTVFRRANAIERKLGVRLFERARDGYGLTAAGEDVVAAAAELEARIGTVERRLAGRDERPSGTVRVTTTDTLLFGLLPPVFAAFRRAHPQIVLEVVADNAVFNLSRREADVALRPSGNPPDNLVGRKLAHIAWAIYRPRKWRLQSEEDLATRDWVMPDDSLSHLASTRWLVRQGHGGNVAYRASSLLALRDAAAQGLGLALLPCYLAHRVPALVRVGAPIAELRNELWLLTHPDLRRVARIRVFMDAMRDAVLALQPVLEGRAVRPAGPGQIPAAAKYGQTRC